jgi:signal transduction histidine kinase
MIYRSRPVYLVLLAFWLLVVAWQGVEHARFQRDSREALINRSKDISSTVGIVLRSQRFFGIISQDRLESALTALVQPEELRGVSILNTRGEIVASAGEPIDMEMNGLVPTGVHWGKEKVALMNLVDLGTNVTSEAEDTRPTIVLSRDELPSPPTNRPPRMQEGYSTNLTNAEGARIEPPPPPREDRDRDRDRGERRRNRAFGRPYWMSEEEYKQAIEKKGVHSFVMVLSTAPLKTAMQHDLWLRLVVSLFGGIAVVGFGFAWRNLARTADLEVRLVRASELNTRLKEMNLAAAGLAHETRNPLNIIRGLAQIISRQADASAAVREKSTSIIDEADRVTAQLNEFINYSRPRKVSRTAVKLSAVLNELRRALGSDLEEKAMTLSFEETLPAIEADEQLLRQTLFNLILNAIQAGERGGHINIVAGREGMNSVYLDIRDDGPGVPVDQRIEIFRPYVTNHPDGTGLGLAVVQQIVTAHGWEITCLPNTPKGAVFHISHIRPAS